MYMNNFYKTKTPDMSYQYQAPASSGPYRYQYNFEGDPIYQQVDLCAPNAANQNYNVIDIEPISASSADINCNCDTCIKRDVCKYTEKYKEYYDKMNQFTEQIKIDEQSIFECKVTCNKYDDGYND